MFHLIHSLWQAATKTEECKILIIGADGSGKTTLLERIKVEFSDGNNAGSDLSRRPLPRSAIVPTVGLNIGRIDAFGRHLLLWDLGGHPSLRPLWANYYPQCQGIIFVVDAVNRSRFYEVKVLLHSLFTNHALVHVPVLILLNKIDLPGAATQTEILDAVALDEICAHPRIYAPMVVLPAAAPKDGGNGVSPPPKHQTVGSREADSHNHPHPDKDPLVASDNSSAFVSPLQNFEISANVVGTGGLGGRAFKFAKVSATEGDGIRPALQWLVGFLVNNARPVATL